MSCDTSKHHESKSVLATRSVSSDLPAPTLRRAFAGRYGFLLMLLLTLVGISPAMVANQLNLVSPLDLLVFTIMLAGLRAANPGRRPFLFGVGLTSATIVMHCGAYLLSNPTLLVAHHVVTLSALAYAQATILTAIIGDTQVTLETLKAAVCGYLLLGLAFVFVFAIIAFLHPGSFLIPTENGGRTVAQLSIRQSFPELMYFSFATLTTLGYAELIPHGAWAKTLCYVEAILGQIYVTILIARLVGMQASRPIEPRFPTS